MFRFQLPPALIMVAAYLCAVSLVLQCVALTELGWATNSDGGDVGLWYHCIENPKPSRWGPDLYCQAMYAEGKAPRWMLFIRGFSYAATVGMSVNFLCIGFSCFYQAHLLNIIAFVGAATAALCTLLETAMWKSWTGYTDYGFCYYFTRVECALCLIAAILVLVSCNKEQPTD